MKECRSTKVRKIVALRTRAAKLAADYEGAQARLAPTRHRARQLLEEARMLKGRLMLYRAITGSGEVDRQGTDPRNLGQRPGRLGRTVAAVAASALGAVGARGVGAPELDLVDVQQTGIPSYPIVNVDGSRVVKASDVLLGAHRDIFHREVAALVAMAAGLLVGGPEGARPAPMDLQVTP